MATENGWDTLTLLLGSTGGLALMAHFFSLYKARQDGSVERLRLSNTAAMDIIKQLREHNQDCEARVDNLEKEQRDTKARLDSLERIVPVLRARDDIMTDHIERAGLTLPRMPTVRWPE